MKDIHVYLFEQLVSEIFICLQMNASFQNLYQLKLDFADQFEPLKPLEKMFYGVIVSFEKNCEFCKPLESIKTLKY